MLTTTKGRHAGRGVVAAVGVLGLAIGTAACGSDSGSSAADGTIKIGVTLSLTGPIAAIGAQELAGMKLAVKTINDAGGVKGKKVELVVTDDKFTPDQAVLNIRKLVQQDDVVAVLGPGSSNSTVAGGQVADQLKTPLVALPSTVGDIWDGAGTLKYAFGTAGDGGALGAGCFNRFREVQKAAGTPVTKIAVGEEESPGP
ncbi:MAG: ethanolamine utilization protein EutJ, partial [Nocardioidaceae bacterium]|nr:ethanolamine utilization protein EutJ [Nocardioidaceae bacterium]